MKKISIISCLIILSLFLLPVFAIAGSATISWQANTDPDLAGYRIYWSTYAGGPYGSSTELITETTSYTITDLAPGIYYFVVTAIDTSGNESGYSTEVTKTISDMQSPTVAITSYLATTGSSLADISGTASDDAAVAQVTWANVTTGESGIATGADTWSVTGISLQLGDNEIRVTATDTSGQQGTDAITVTRTDTQSPTVAIISPTSAESYETNISSIDISGGASDNVGISQVIWANSNGGSGTAIGTDSWSVSGLLLAEGENLITVTATDDAGNQGIGTLTVSYTPPDTTAPTIVIISPTNAATYETDNSSIDISGSASDNIGLSEVRWATANGGSGIATGTGNWSVSGIALLKGENIITVEALDTTGNVGTSSLVVTYPNPTTPPTVSITSPANDASFSSGESISFAGSASDTEDGDLTTSLVWISDLDGQIGTGGSFSKTLIDGTHTITAGVTDSRNNVGSEGITITVVGVDSGGGIISLSVVSSKIKGDKYAHLTWSGANSTSVDVYHDGVLIATTASNANGDGEYIHGPFSSGKPATYKICDNGTSTCSNEVTVSW